MEFEDPAYPNRILIDTCHRRETGTIRSSESPRFGRWRGEDSESWTGFPRSQNPSDFYRERSDVRHFDVQLRELQLPILPPAFIPKATRDLEVPIDSAGHQYLLVLLGRLAQCKTAARNQSRRNVELVRSLLWELRKCLLRGRIE